MIVTNALAAIFHSYVNICNIINQRVCGFQKPDILGFLPEKPWDYPIRGMILKVESFIILGIESAYNSWNVAFLTNNVWNFYWKIWFDGTYTHIYIYILPSHMYDLHQGSDISPTNAVTLSIIPTLRRIWQPPPGSHFQTARRNLWGTGWHDP